MIELIGGPLDGLLLRFSGTRIPVTWLPDGKGVLGWNTGGDWTAIYHGPAQKLQHIGWMSEQGSLESGLPVATVDDDHVA